MSEPFRTTRRVQFRETDAAGIAHFTSFFGYMEEAEHALLRDLGLSVMMPAEGGHLSWPRVSARCEYRAPVRFEDVLTVSVAIRRLGRKAVTYGFRFELADQLIAEGEMVAVCCRVEAGRPPQAVPIPKELASRLAMRLIPPREGDASPVDRVEAESLVRRRSEEDATGRDAS